MCECAAAAAAAEDDTVLAAVAAAGTASDTNLGEGDDNVSVGGEDEDEYENGHCVVRGILFHGSDAIAVCTNDERPSWSTCWSWSPDNNYPPGYSIDPFTRMLNSVFQPVPQSCGVEEEE